MIMHIIVLVSMLFFCFETEENANFTCSDTVSFKTVYHTDLISYIYIISNIVIRSKPPDNIKITFFPESTGGDECG